MTRDFIRVYETPSQGVYRRVGHALLRHLLPMQCLECDGLAQDGFRDLGLCARCRGRISYLHPPRCPVCCLPARAGDRPQGFVCIACRASPPAYDRLIAPWSYEPPVDTVIQALKFSRLPQLAEPLARQLVEQLQASGDAVFDVVTFVPLHWRRRLQRGYDQAEELAKSVARSLAVDVERSLVRRRFTPAQSGLSLARRARNVAGAFRPRRRSRSQGARVLLVDDVATTGATLSAAARCLATSGARSVTAAVVARTPPPGEQMAKRPTTPPRSHSPFAAIGW